MKTTRLQLSLILSVIGGQLFGQTEKMDALLAHFTNADEDYVQVVAHRGDWRNAPENSLQALQNCIDMGVDMVEIDVRMTRDSVLVLMHDYTIDRTTTGSGVLRDFTYDSLQNFYLKNGLLQSTPHKIPTLEEALLMSKDQILINLDTKDYQNLRLYYDLLQETGTLHQVVIKAPISKVEAQQIFGEYLDEIFFMPLVRTASPGAMRMVREYQQEDPPVAFEFTVPSDTTQLLPYFPTIREKGSRVWVNSLRPGHCAGHDDEQAAINLSVYNWFIDHKVNLIQTDRPELLIRYLQKRDLHD